MDFLGMGPLEVLAVLVVALIFLGPQRIVEVASQMGKAVREFRKATTQLTDEITREMALEEITKPQAKPTLGPPPESRSREQSPEPGQPPEPKQ